MKKSICLCLLSFLISSGFLCAQDVILKKDNTIIKAKVVSFEDTDVLYKAIQNLTGPNYRLPLEEVEQIVFEDGREWTKGDISTRKAQPEDVHLIKKVDDSYNVQDFKTSADILKELYDMYASYQEALSKGDQDKMDLYYQRIPKLYGSQKSGRRDKVDKLAIADLDRIFHQEADEDVVLEYIERLLFILPNDHPLRFNLIQMIGDIYHDMDNQVAFLNAVERMKRCPDAGKEENRQVIENYTSQALSMTSLEQTLGGYWISDMAGELNYYKQDVCGGPFLVLNFGEPYFNRTSGTEVISPMSSFLRTTKVESIRRPDSFILDPPGNTFAFEFYGSTVKQGNYRVAEQVLSTDQDLQAILTANRKEVLNNPHISFADQMKFTAATAAIGVGIHIMAVLIANSASTSTVNVDQVLLQGTKYNHDELNTQLNWTSQKMESGSNYVALQENSEQLRLWRWKPEDNIVFGDPKCNPISPYVTELTEDMELYRIKKDTRFWQVKYALPVFAGCAGTIGLFAGGCALVDYLSDGTDDPKRSTRILTYGITTLLGVLLTGIELSVSLPIMKQKRTRAIAVGEYNERQMARLNALKTGRK